MQTKKHSLIESITNTFVGFVISFVIQLIIYPMMNIPVTFTQNILITIVFTVVSILRGYVVRRFFNNRQYKTDNKTTFKKILEFLQKCGKSCPRETKWN